MFARETSWHWGFGTSLAHSPSSESLRGLGYGKLFDPCFLVVKLWWIGGESWEVDGQDSGSVEQETAHLAISLILADAINKCPNCSNSQNRLSGWDIPTTQPGPNSWSAIRSCIPGDIVSICPTCLGPLDRPLLLELLIGYKRVLHSLKGSAHFLRGPDV